ncbi:MAG TPA: MinD/ParA family protein [Woeseiaceae bacterium]|nr:MinD/ParA family protein [Woeseiaceae bacterium]
MRDGIQAGRLRRELSRPPTKVFAVCSGKGGVGKTSVAANLAVALGILGRKVYLLDADVSLANVDVLLGLQPRYNLSHVLAGEVDLESTVLVGPSNIRIVPASSGNFNMTDLCAASQAALIQAFSTLTSHPDVLVVDTSAGISSDVARFVQAAQHAVVVVCDEPASLTDAYALIKVFSQNYGITRFNIVTNQSNSRNAGDRLFNKLRRVTDSYLDVVIRHLADIPEDRMLVKAVQQQRAVLDAFPQSSSGAAFLRLGKAADALPVKREASGGIEFFFERLLVGRNYQRGAVA